MSKADASKVMDYFDKVKKGRSRMYKDSYNEYMEQKKKGGPCMTCGKKKK